MNKIAIISDIHGNLPALKSVLEDIQHLNINEIYNLGDVLYGPLLPLETHEFLKNQNIVNIRGNCDRALTEPVDFSNSTMNQVRKSINNEIKEWLYNLPKTIMHDDMLFCHGTPSIDNEYLLEKVTHSGVEYKKQEELEKELSLINARYIFCGHSHVCNIVKLKNKVIINVGSVGLPAYEDELPYIHKMESGSPSACYCIFEKFPDNSYHIDFRKVMYNWEEMAILAENKGRNDWAIALRTGKV